MLLDLTITAALLIAANFLFWRFDPQQPIWRRALKVVLALVAIGCISHSFGRTGALIALAAMLTPVVLVHAIWLPMHGVNGFTGEPRERYEALRSRGSRSLDRRA